MKRPFAKSKARSCPADRAVVCGRSVSTPQEVERRLAEARNDLARLGGRI